MMKFQLLSQAGATIFMLAWLAGCAASPVELVRPQARAFSQPAPVNKVNDAAIWVHPTDEARSLLLISNELRGVELHDMDGSLQKLYDEEDIRPNNVDLIYDFALGGGLVDLALVSCQNARSAGVKVFKIDPEKRRLTDITADHFIDVFGGAPASGLCAYHSQKTGKSYLFATSRSGRIEQHELIGGGDGTVSSKLVRSLERASKVKFCVADDERGVVYFSEEKTGIWRFGAEPDAPGEGKCVIRANENGLIPDIVGLALYCGGGGKGYLIAVSQGPRGGKSTLKVYERAGENRFVLTIDPAGEPYGKLERISGVAVSNRAISATFPRGVLAANDRINSNASEDFKLFSWEDIAGPGHLLMDTDWSPRAARR